MKKLIFSSLVFMLSIQASRCQTVDTLYYTLLDNEATPKRYTYYRVVRSDSNLIRVFDYWKNGEIFMSGGFKSIDFKEKTGPFTYYNNNRITRIRLFEPSKYPDFLSSFKAILERIPQQPDSLSLSIFFHKDKKFHSAGYVSECCFRYGTWIFISKDGNEAVLETYKNNILHGPLEIYYKKQLWLQGTYTNGKKDLEWSYYDDKNNLYKTILYSAGKKLKVINYHSGQ